MKLNPSTRISSSVELTTWEILDNMSKHMVFTFFIINLKKFFLKSFLNQNLTVLKKLPNFFILTASKNIKIHRANFKFVCSYKDCDQFLHLKNYRFWH